MIIKLLGFLDLLSALAMVLLHFDVAGWRFGIYFVVYLAIKGWIFKGDFASIIDMAGAVYIVLLIFGVSSFVTWIFVVYFVEKSIMGFI